MSHTSLKAGLRWNTPTGRPTKNRVQAERTRECSRGTTFVFRRRGGRETAEPSKRPVTGARRVTYSALASYERAVQPRSSRGDFGRRIPAESLQPAGLPLLFLAD